MLFLEHILELPRLVIAPYTIDRFPESRCLYFVIKYNKILYIGRAENLRDRWENHHKILMCYELECDLHWLKFENSFDLVEAETKHILFHAPPWNSFGKAALNLGRDPKDVVESEKLTLVGELRNQIKSQKKKIASLEDEIRRNKEGESKPINSDSEEELLEEAKQEMDKIVFRKQVKDRLLSLGRRQTQET